MDLVLGFFAPGAHKVLSVVPAATKWTFLGAWSFSRRRCNPMARRHTIERAQTLGALALSMAHLRAMGLSHRRDKENLTPNSCPFAPGTTDKAMSTHGACKPRDFAIPPLWSLRSWTISSSVLFFKRPYTM